MHNGHNYASELWVWGTALRKYVNRIQDRIKLLNQLWWSHWGFEVRRAKGLFHY